MAEAQALQAVRLAKLEPEPEPEPDPQSAPVSCDRQGVVPPGCSAVPPGPEGMATVAGVKTYSLSCSDKMARWQARTPNPSLTPPDMDMISTDCNWLLTQSVCLMFSA